MCTVHAPQGSKSVYYSVVNGLDNNSLYLYVDIKGVLDFYYQEYMILSYTLGTSSTEGS